MDGVGSKKDLGHALGNLHAELLDELGEKYPVEQLEAVFDEVVREDIRRGVLSDNRRLDGRDTKTVRSISCEVGLLPRAHGSGLFSNNQPHNTRLIYWFLTRLSEVPF